MSGQIYQNKLSTHTSLDSTLAFLTGSLAGAFGEDRFTPTDGALPLSLLLGTPPFLSAGVAGLANPPAGLAKAPALGFATPGRGVSTCL